MQNVKILKKYFNNCDILFKVNNAHIKYVCSIFKDQFMSKLSIDKNLNLFCTIYTFLKLE